MSKSSYISGIILGAAAALALYKFFSMTEEERDELLHDIKEKTKDLLDNAEDTVEKVEHYVAQIKEKGEGEWVDKMYLAKKMIREFYGASEDKVKSLARTAGVNA
ncbi:MAG: hypothetical protein ABIY51_02635 [Ferruginibacter sp.]